MKFRQIWSHCKCFEALHASWPNSIYYSCYDLNFKAQICNSFKASNHSQFLALSVMATKSFIVFVPEQRRLDGVLREVRLSSCAAHPRVDRTGVGEVWVDLKDVVGIRDHYVLDLSFLWSIGVNLVLLIGELSGGIYKRRESMQAYLISELFLLYKVTL